MEAKAYNGLMDFLCNTLTPSELKRLGEQLVNHAKMKEEEEELQREEAEEAAKQMNQSIIDKPLCKRA